MRTGSPPPRPPGTLVAPKTRSSLSWVAAATDADGRVIGRRVERARELLSGTDLPVGDVAGAVGFSHQSHLAYHVRRRFGVFPSARRR